MTSPTWKDRAAPRVAEAGEGISHDELALAARNHGMPTEALRWDTTPVGLHYVLVHYDIPGPGPDDVAAPCRRRRRQQRRAVAGRPRGDAAPYGARDAGVRGQRTGAARAAPGEPAVADRRGGHRRLDRCRGSPTCSRSAGVRAGRRRRAVPRGRPRHGAGRRAGLRARPADGRGRARRRAGRDGDERRTAAGPARLPGPARGARVVRHGAREVADRHRGARPDLRRLPAPVPTGCGRHPRTRVCR